MHELAAAILLVVDLDALPHDSSGCPQDLVSLTLSREYVEHDTWTLYESVMKHAKAWYQWREEEASSGAKIGGRGNRQVSAVSAHPCLVAGGSRRMTDLSNSISSLLQPPKKLDQPIVTICNHMHGTLLRSLDPQLWTQLEQLGIEPQIFGIRWIRLIFTREFPVRVPLLIASFKSRNGLTLLLFLSCSSTTPCGFGTGSSLKIRHFDWSSSSASRCC